MKQNIQTKWIIPSVDDEVNQALLKTTRNTCENQNDNAHRFRMTLINYKVD